MSEAARLPLHRRPAFWAGGIFAAFGIISALRMTDAIGSTTGFILMVIAMLQIIPLTRASLAKQRSTDHLSPAIVRYTRRFLLASFGYMLGLGIAVTIADRVDLSEIESFLIALLPVIPVLGMIWTMARYLIEEEDEFLRHRAIMASLFGLLLGLPRNLRSGPAHLGLVGLPRVGNRHGAGPVLDGAGRPPRQ